MLALEKFYLRSENIACNAEMRRLRMAVHIFFHFILVLYRIAR
jgi:hypothetical protein